MNKPTYYLWKNDFPTLEDFKAVKEMYIALGFRIVTYQDRKNEKDIHEGLKALIKNHINRHGD